MARYGRLLTDAQWEKIRPLLPKRSPRPRGGRPPANDRKRLEGILWMLRSGGSLAGFARGVSVTLDLLATVAGLGGARGLARNLASVSGRVE